MIRTTSFCTRQQKYERHTKQFPLFPCPRHFFLFFSNFRAVHVPKWISYFPHLKQKKKIILHCLAHHALRLFHTGFVPSVFVRVCFITSPKAIKQRTVLFRAKRAFEKSFVLNPYPSWDLRSVNTLPRIRAGKQNSIPESHIQICSCFVQN